MKTAEQKPESGYPVILSDDELKKKNTRNLLFILKKVRRFVSNIGWCELCHDYCGYVHEPSELDHRVKEYVDRIKAILATREHVSRPGRETRSGIDFSPKIPMIKHRGMWIVVNKSEGK